MINNIEVLNVSEPDQITYFEKDGNSAFFGRDDDLCDIVIWSALNDRNLSRVAGRLWRMDGQLWLRNLSLRHELVVCVPGSVMSPPLAPRLGPADPGEARCLATGTSVILGPGGCELVVTQSSPRVASSDRGRFWDLAGSGAERTIDLPDIPARVRQVALALCEPLLLGAPMPATYRQIALRLGISSVKRVRTLVAELCLVYADAATASYLNGGVPRTERRAPEAETRPVQLTRGVWRFLSETPPQDDARPRAHELVLPDYLAVAQMLVRRGLVRPADLDELTAEHPADLHQGSRHSFGSIGGSAMSG